MSEPPSKRRRVELSLEDKIKLIKESEMFPKPTLKILSEKYRNCASNPERSITDRASQIKLKFLSHYLETSGNEQGAVAEQRYRQATNLYYRLMKRLLDIERERLAPLKDFSSLLNNDVFHRSLLACSTEIVLTTYNVSSHLSDSSG
ncbi:hypothetical protein DPMN_140172 [Dreissena polymorpha]|uniref:Retinoblastoma-associated protein A-box domain-containing protein n=1 Tax=Dreissena polymorpha TaxID=45954 RepID=A0A9D4GD21_DREPO|nr:hypothetical protein DPMN_140172 [Dreissena polymorpha]